jgi:FtsP/CotA-like multicopper oxidase with cupredoxin domain
MIGAFTGGDDVKPARGVPAMSASEVHFIANDRVRRFFHCHHQDHMDTGFAGLISYV